jgi:hypothetical protein
MRRMTMKRGILSAAIAAALVAIGSSAAQAAEVTTSDDATHEIRVVNNHSQPVRVYVQDARGRMHQLGRVARGKLRILEVSDEIASMGDLRVKVYPAAPIGTLSGAEYGIRSKDLDLSEGGSVNLFLEATLSHSLIQVSEG